MKVLAYDEYPNKALETDNCKYASLDQLLAQADVISLHSIAILNSYLYFKEREIQRIITTIEKIRYGLGAS